MAEALRVVNNVEDDNSVEQLIDELAILKEEIAEMYQYKASIEKQIKQYLNDIKATKACSKQYQVTLKKQTAKQRVADPSIIQEFINHENTSKNLKGDKAISIDNIGKLEVKLSLTKLNSLCKFGYLTNAKEQWFEPETYSLEIQKI